MTAATELVGVSQVFPGPPMESLSKDRYFMSGSGIGNVSGIAEWFKNSANVEFFLVILVGLQLIYPSKSLALMHALLCVVLIAKINT